MSFSRAKSKRFNELASCAPPVGSYDPKLIEKVPSALINSKDERFKEPKPIESSYHLLSHSSSISMSLPSLTPKKQLSSASSMEALASEHLSSGIPKRAPSSSNIMAPADLAKLKDLEKQLRLLVQERNELHRRVQLKDDELKKVESRLQQTLKERTALIANLAAHEKELADLKKGNETLKAKAQEFNVDRQRHLQAELNLILEKLKKKDKEISDAEDKLKSEIEKKNLIIKSLELSNLELAKTNADLSNDSEDKSRQLHLLLVNNDAYESELEKLEEKISQLKCRNQKFLSEETRLYDCCDHLQLLVPCFENLQKQAEGFAESLIKWSVESLSTETVDENVRDVIMCDINSFKASLDSCIACYDDDKFSISELKLKLRELIEAVVSDVNDIKSAQFALLTSISKAVECSRNEEALKQSVRGLTDRIKELECNIESAIQDKEECCRRATETKQLDAENQRLSAALVASNDLISSQQSEISGCSVKISEFQSQISGLADQLMECRAQKESLEELRGRLQVDLSDSQTKVLILQDANKVVSLSLENVKEQLISVRKERDNCLEQVNDLTTNRSDLMTKVSEMEELTEALKERLAETGAQLSKVLLETDGLNAEKERLKGRLEETSVKCVDQQNRLAKYELEMADKDRLLSSHVETITILEESKSQLQRNMEETVKDLHEEIASLSGKASEMQSRVHSSEMRLSESNISLAASLEDLSKKERDNEHLSRELELAQGREEEAENLVSRLQGEVQTIRLQLEQADFGKTELEVAKAYIEKDLLEANSRLKELSVEMESLRRHVEELEASNSMLRVECDDKSTRICDLEDNLDMVNCLLSDAKDTIAKLEDIQADRRNLAAELTQELEELKTKILKVEREKDELVGQISNLTQMHDNSLKQIELKTVELINSVKEKEDLQDKIRETEETKKLLEEECDRRIAQCQELEQSLIVAQSNFSAKETQVMLVETEKDNLTVALSSAREQLAELGARCAELDRRHQSVLRNVADDRTMMKKHLEMELQKSHEMFNMKSAELETLSAQFSALEKTNDRQKEKYHMLEVNSSKELQLSRQRMEEQQLNVERLKTSQQEMHIQSDRLRNLLDNKARELNELCSKVQHQQKTIDRFAEQMNELNQTHEKEKNELKKKLSDSRMQPQDDLSRVTENMNRWKTMYEELWNKVQPFKDQLEAFEQEKQLLLGRSKNAQLEIEKLSHDYAKILGHQNQKQKIHHILKLKEENFSLKKEVDLLRDKELKNRRQIGQLTEKLDALEGKKRFDPSKAFQNVKENDTSTVGPLREGNR